MFLSKILMFSSGTAPCSSRIYAQAWHAAWNIPCYFCMRAPIEAVERDRSLWLSEPSLLPICRQSAGSLLSFNLKRLVGPLPRSLVGLPTCPFSSLIFNQLFFNPGPSAIWQNTPFELAFKRITFAGPRVPPIRARPAPPRPVPACAAPARLGLRRPGPARPGPASPDTST